MTDRPNPQGPEQHSPDSDAATATPAPERTGPAAASEAAPDAAAPAPSAPEPIPMSVPVEPIPLEPTPPLPTATAEPAPEPESPQSHQEPRAEPHSSVEVVADAATIAGREYAQSAAPAQIAPESGAPPIPMEPEPSVPDPVSPEPGAPVVLAAETETTLALPPTTKEVEPPPVPSTPPPPTGVPVPFAAPPTGHSRFFGLKLGFGITGGALAIIGVVVSVVVALLVFTNSITEKVEDTAGEFIGAIAQDDWDTAYAMLCDSYRERPVEAYTDEWDAWDAEDARIRSMSATGNVMVEFADGSAIELTIPIEQTPETLTTSVCGWRSVAA